MNLRQKSNLRYKIIMLQLYFLNKHFLHSKNRSKFKNLKNIFTPFKFAEASLNLEKPTLN
jgi:hypothetical protein